METFTLMYILSQNIHNKKKEAKEQGLLFSPCPLPHTPLLYFFKRQVFDLQNEAVSYHTIRAHKAQVPKAFVHRGGSADGG